ncbi:MAG: hypothetical protein KGD63_05450 [Candidatus Lokiarchaeota archaeon]|nr:hypothetical protein [Candidatus Lokiarchaeota archaeon]
MKISKSETKISIGSEKISIKDKYTIISGNIEKDNLNFSDKETVFETFDSFNFLSLDNFLSILNKFDKSYKKLDEYHNMLEFLILYKKISENNISILNDYISSLEQSYTYLELNILISEIKSLEEELELSKIRDKSSLLSAKTDFLHKLDFIINKNKDKLSFLKEDYHKIKNQRVQIIRDIQNYKEDINDLSIKKKEKFNEINKITRNMEDPKYKKDDLLIESTLSNSEMIKKLREEAKNIHNDINQTKLDLKKSNEELKNIEPKFNVYEKDYNDLSSMIQKKEEQIKNTQTEIEKGLSNNNQIKLDKLHQFEKIRSSIEIQKDIENKKSVLEQINNSEKLIRGNSQEEFLKTIKEFSRINRYVNNNQEDLIFLPEKTTLISSIEKYRDLELLINKIEYQLNQFLITINLKTELQIKLEKEKLFLQMLFIRNNKEYINFDELTTPEKVLFVVMLFISIKIILNFKIIIFSNLFIHQNYNKRGSLFRTIEKIIPIFEKNENLKDISLIFIISNLEMKKSINNINLIKI